MTLEAKLELKCDRVWNMDAALKSIEASFNKTKDCKCPSYDFVVIDMDDAKLSFPKIAAMITQKNAKVSNHKTTLIGLSNQEQMNKPVCEALGAKFTSKGISEDVFSAMIMSTHPEKP